ncbi:MAG: LAGLIDADG family homing endonuclease [Haloferacaceae archaeon]
MRPDDERYFAAIESRLDEAMAVAEAARSQGRDPRTEVEIPVAADMADRVEKVLGIEGVAERVRDLEGDRSREEAALALARDFAEGRVGDYDTRAGRIEGAVRTAVALLTEGVVAAPIEGIDRVELLENDDGGEFVNVYYAGPIRSAGGTAQALSVLVADYARALLDLDGYRARDAETERYAEEVTLYDEETGLQYSPSDDETRYIAEHMPVMLDGEATGDAEVSGFRDLERVDTNNPRGGMCLVLAEGIALKAPKIQRYTRDLDEVDWPWLDDLIDGNVGSAGDAADADADTDADGAAESAADGEAGAGEAPGADAGGPSGDAPPRPAPSKKYLRDLIAGRPVFGHPSEPGGFRLRYGRARNHGHATAGVHPATMHLVDDFLATGTQIKTERPGKAAGVVPVDSIEGPTVRLANGEVRRIDDPAEAIEVRNGVEAVLDLGEYLVNYGEFVENNHPLAPAAYAYEWWVQEFAATGADVRALRDDPHVDLRDPGPEEALRWATEYDAPLHPAYTYLWHDVSVAEFEALAAAAADGSFVAAADGGRAVGPDGASTAPDGDGDGDGDGGSGGALLIDDDPGVRRTLERLLVEHRRTDEGVVVPDPLPLVRSLGLTPALDRPWGPADVPESARTYADGANAIRAVNAVAPFAVRERAPTRVGNRMGRPEKSESRDLSPAVHTLFPVGPAGGPQRDVAAAAAAADAPGAGALDLALGRRACPDCGHEGYRIRCPDCGAHTEPRYECDDCGRTVAPDESGRVVCPRCDREVTSVEEWPVPLHEHYRGALAAVGERENAFEILKGVRGLSSAHKTPEPLEKGVLRAKHGVTAFKDGTVRYDMTDLPVTAVRPAELGVTADRLRALGYETDVDGEPLRFDDQLVELRVQDVVLSEGAADHLLRTADFVDDLLASFYGLDPFYEVDERDDLVGELVFGMAPHTSAAVVGRVVGFTSAAVGYAHPYFHAAKRRNCFHPDTKVWYENGDGEWRHERIESLVERYLDPAAAAPDDFGTLVDDSVTGLRVPSLDATGDQSLRSVEAVSKHPSPDHLVRVTTRSGRELTLTPDHEVHVRDPDTDRLVGREARSLAEDDSLVLPSHLDPVGPTRDPERLDLLSAFAGSDAVPDDRLMVKGLDKDRLYHLFESLFDDEVDDFHPLTSTAEHLGLTKKTLSNYLYRGSIPVALLDELFESRDDLLRFVPDDATLGMKRDRTEIDRFVELNERVATLLGYYAAEGFAREGETTHGTIHQTTICGTETEVREFVLDTFREDFGVEPYEESDAKITVSGRLPRVLFDTILNAGAAARTKRVPGPVFDASDDVVAAYLRGYFSGDGAVEAGDMVVSATTVSPELEADLLALLTRLGIKARVRETDPVPLETKFPDDYAADGPTSAPGYRLRISSTDAVRFHERVGFHLSRKTDRLAADVETTEVRGRRIFDGGSEDYLLDEIAETEIVASDVDHVYCLTVEDTHSLIANDVSAKQCDGDEDCVMLLLDGLLNFSTEYLPDQRGGSVAEDSRLVAVSPEGEVRFTTFGEFWDELDGEVVRDGRFRKRTCRSDGWRTYVFDDRHESSLAPIEKAIRYPAGADETLLRVETQFGRSLDITADHSLFRYDDGIEEVAGADLREGDLVLAPRDLDVDPVETTIDAADAVDDPYVFIDDRVEDLLTTVWESTDRGSPAHEAFMEGLSYRLARRKIGFDRFDRILAAGGFEGVPADVSIGLKGSETGIAREIDLDEEFAWLLGLFVADGTLSGDYPAIHNADEGIVDRATEVVASRLGHDPSVRWSNRAYEIRLPTVLREVFYDLGFVDAESYDSSEKLIPDCVLRAPREVVLSFLRGFIAGDGSEASDDNVTTVSFHTTSDDVRDGVVFLLHRLGLVATVSTTTDREGNRQDIHTVTVSGGATDNPLRRILDGKDPYRPKSLVVPVPDALLEIRRMDIDDVKQLIPKYLLRRENVSLEKLREMVAALDGRDLPADARERLDDLRPLVDGDLSYLRVTSIEEVDYDGFLYDLQVGGEPIFTANWLYAHNSMDAPLVMSSRIDPAEIDDEAHNVDVVERYPRSFYEATREMADPGAVDVRTAEDALGTDDQYRGFAHTHDTTDIALGPELSAYKTLGSMTEKTDAQLELARKLRAVDEGDVAERIIEYHFLPDLIGNLRAFTSQETRCLDCGTSYRRMPLTRDCRECGGDMTLTVHEGSVSKYLDTALRVAREYDCREYTKQRLEILDRSIERVFEDDTNKQSGIADFM